jgi:uncharacterized phage infection (PIP) family protein YhgE
METTAGVKPSCSGTVRPLMINSIADETHQASELQSGCVQHLRSPMEEDRLFTTILRLNKSNQLRFEALLAQVTSLNSNIVNLVGQLQKAEDTISDKLQKNEDIISDKLHNTQDTISDKLHNTQDTISDKLQKIDYISQYQGERIDRLCVSLQYLVHNTWVETPTPQIE